MLSVKYSIMCGLYVYLVGPDLAMLVKPLKRLCTVSLSEMEDFLNINKQQQHLPTSL